MPGESKLENMNIQVDEGNKCCMCIPIDIGVKIIGVGMILGAINVVMSVVNGMQYGGVYAPINGVIGLPFFYSAYLFIKFLRNDTKETRAKLPKACTFVCISAIA